MLNRLQLENLDITELRNLMQECKLKIPQHAKADDLRNELLAFYGKRAEEIKAEDDGELTPPATPKEAVVDEDDENSEEVDADYTPEDEVVKKKRTVQRVMKKGERIGNSIATPTSRGRYGKFKTRKEYLNYHLALVPVIITAYDKESQQLDNPTSSIGIKNSIIPHRIVSFVCDGVTPCNVPRIAIKRIAKKRILVRGNQSLNKEEMKGSFEGSAFAPKFRIHEMSEAEIEEWKASTKRSKEVKNSEGFGI